MEWSTSSGTEWRNRLAGHAETTASLLRFVTAAGVVGALTGLVAGSFRLVLTALTEWRAGAISTAHASSVGGFLLVVASCAAATSAAAWLVHRVEPHAEGSGIPRVEAVVEARTEPGRYRILPVKYIGGLLSMGAGLALGREGPSVQMGGNLGIMVATLTRRSRADLRVLVAAGAAAGLATAFNAPIAGGVFVLEELLKRFDPRTTLATLVASASGFAAAHVLLRDVTEFRIPHLDEPRLDQAPVVFAVGLVAGILGVLYNRSIMAALHRADASQWPAPLRGALIGAGVGAVAWFAPDLVGTGDNLTQLALLGGGAILPVLGLLVARWVLGVVSYAAGTPGGLFAPMLVIGSTSGLLVGLVSNRIAPTHTPETAALALIGMAALFTASVRAPVTGLILATEMTGTTILLPPMLGACAVAMAVPAVLRAQPIYDMLTERAARAAALNAAEKATAARDHGGG